MPGTTASLHPPGMFHLTNVCFFENLYAYDEGNYQAVSDEEHCPILSSACYRTIASNNCNAKAARLSIAQSP